MNERDIRRSFRNPTADIGVALADRNTNKDKRRNTFPIEDWPRHVQRSSPKQSLFPTQAQIERRIHTLRIQLAEREISSACYKMAVYPLRSSLRRIPKGNS